MSRHIFSATLFKIMVSAVICCNVAFGKSTAGNNTGDTIRHATVLKDTISVSLLTCAPGPLIYELYGHTAIRIKILTTGDDLAFNYGMFDFRKPNFVMRFIKGETDYMLGVYPFDDFLEEYKERGSDVTEQSLNLTPEEKERLLYSLVRNALPANCVYRYNFFYANCTSKARDMIERCIDGEIVYPYDEKPESFREIIHIYTKNNPWAEFGQDLLLGAGADKPISQREKMFAPLFLKKYVDKAIIVSDNGLERPLVNSTKTIKPYKETKQTTVFFLSPSITFGTLLVLTIILCFIELKTKKIFWGHELLLRLAQGIAGCIIAFLFLCSEHPTVKSNWLLVILNPIPIIYVAFRIRNIRKRKYDFFVPVAFAIEALFFVAMPFIPQNFSFAVYCFALSLCLHSGTCTYLQHKLKWKKAA